MSDLAQGARTKAGLIAASIELFDRDGYERTSLEAVCRRVSVTKGALYRHFPSKQALAVAVVEEHFRRWHAVRAEVERTGVGPLQALIDVTHRMSALTRTEPAVRVGVRLLFTSELFELLGGMHFVSLVVMARDLLDQAVAAGEVADVDVREEADGITAAIIGSQALTVVTDRDDPADRLTTMWRYRVAHLVAPGLGREVRVTAAARRAAPPRDGRPTHRPTHRPTRAERDCDPVEAQAAASVSGVGHLQSGRPIGFRHATPGGNLLA